MLPAHLRDLPYLLHTNRELGLMLRGTKPLAYFVHVLGTEPECVLRYYRLFDRHVALGRFVRREAFDTAPELPGRVQKRVLYSLPEQEWRIDAMLALVALPGSWTRGRERKFGELLGYEEWQNDHWLTRLPSSWRL
jgi:hypothetical protein